MIDLDDIIEEGEQDAQNGILVCNTCPFCNVTYCFVSGEYNIRCNFGLRETNDNEDWFYSCGYTLSDLNKLGDYGYKSWDYEEIRKQISQIEMEI